MERKAIVSSNTTMRLKQKHKEAERRRLNGEKPTRDQIKSIVRHTRYITPMRSVKVLDDIASKMMPERI